MENVAVKIICMTCVIFMYFPKYHSCWSVKDGRFYYLCIYLLVCLFRTDRWIHQLALLFISSNYGVIMNIHFNIAWKNNVLPLFEILNSFGLERLRKPREICVVSPGHILNLRRPEHDAGMLPDRRRRPVNENIPTAFLRGFFVSKIKLIFKDATNDACGFSSLFPQRRRFVYIHKVILNSQ